MKKIAGRNFVFRSVLAFSTILFFLSSCTKEVEVEVPAAPIDTLAVLTSNTYHMEEILILNNNQFFYYKRGGNQNTASFDNEFIKFNANKTGSYSYNNVVNTLTWDFINGNKTKIRYTLNRPTPIEITWENINYNKDSLTYSEYYTVNGLNSMSTVLRTAR
jgi:hypothetical protein